MMQNLFVQKLTELNTIPLKFVKKIYNYEITLDEAKDDQMN